MTPQLYSIRGERNENKVRQYILDHGGIIARERVQPLLTGDMIQFHVLCDGEYWFLDPNSRLGYAWFKVRSNCTCAQPCCRCREGQAAL